jgi:hypothetical protein
MLKEQFGSHMVLFYFIFWMIKKMLMWNTFKLWDVFFYSNPILVCNFKVQAKKGLIVYNTTNGIITLEKMWMQNILLLQKCWKFVIWK